MQHVRLLDGNSVREVRSSSSAEAGRRAISSILVPFSVAYLAGAFATDLLYWLTAEVMCERLSVWLIAAGLIMAGPAVIAAVIDIAGSWFRPAWPRVIAYALIILVSLVNAFIHSRDGYTAIVPTGLMLSGLVVVILLAMAPAGWALTTPRRVGADR